MGVYIVDEELRNIQKECFKILHKFKEVCNNNGFKYYLAFGTLLGAIRHKGYIPWDDDIDVWMPRPDLIKFMSVAEEQMQPYVINYYTIKNKASFKYRSQPCIEDQKVKVGFNLGNTIKNGYIWIDVMPLDGMPSNKILQKIRCIRFRIMYILIGFARSAKIGAFNKNSKKGLQKIGIVLNEKLKIGKLLNIDKRLYKFDKFRTKYSFPESELVIGSTTTYIEKAIFNKEWFDGERYAEFEGEDYQIPAEAELILKRLYNNYMQLPPEDKRVRSHFSKLYKTDD